MDNAIGDGKANALGNNGHRHWTAFSVPSGDDPLQAFQTVAKPPTALLEPVELDELHPIQSQNDVSPAGNDNDQKAIGEGDQKPPQGTRKANNNEVLLTVAPGATASASSSTDGGKQQEMKNGKLLTTVYPKNVPFFWIRQPTFDGTAMPPVLANPQNRLTPDAYSNIVRTVEKDSRFVSYAMFYSRMIPVWLVFSIVILLAVLASSPMGGLPIVLALRNLVKEVNTISQTYRILVGVQDRGLIFVFYDFDGCREDVARQLRVQQANYAPSAANNSLSDIEIADKAEGLMLDYAQAYIKGLVKLRLRFPTRPSEGVSDFLPRHVAKSHCLCQFVATEHFHKGPQKRLAPCILPFCSPTRKFSI
uniref:Transmembrane protein n=1 Tax=Globodera pallida TaxID=36090 RepID=A0A183CHR6_GLOPA